MSARSSSDPAVRVRAVSLLAPRSVDWLWPGRLALGKLSILDGDPGLGKSLVALDLCARLSTGQPWPEGAAGLGPCATVYLNGEDGNEDTIRPRLEALGADLSRVFVLHQEDDAELLRLPSQTHVLQAAVAQTGARLVVIDPIMAFLEPSVFIGNDQSVRRALTPLAALARKHGCCVLLIRHLNKRGGGRAVYRGAASIGFLAVCRSGWLVGRDPEEPARRVLAEQKNNLGPAQPSLAYEIVSKDSAPPTLHWLGPARVPPISSWPA